MKLETKILIKETLFWCFIPIWIFCMVKLGFWIWNMP